MVYFVVDDKVFYVMFIMCFGFCNFFKESFDFFDIVNYDEFCFDEVLVFGEFLDKL